jgi:hypothetical protein
VGNVRGVHANLVGAAGVQYAAQQAKAAVVNIAVVGLVRGLF